MLRTIFKAVAVSAVAAFFCVGCGDKSDDDPDDVGGETKATYTITFDANGGTVSPKSAKTGTDGKLDSLPTPTRTGYDFDGWFTAKTGGSAVAVSRTYTANATIYARWTEKSVNPPDTANPANPGDTTGNGASGLVLGIEEAWLFEPEEGETEQSGLIFKQNGTVEVVYTEDGDTWHIAEDESGTYTLSGNNSITVKIFGDTITMTFSISGNKLTFKYSDGSTDVLTKKNGVKIDDSGEVGETLYTINFDANGGTVSPTSGKTNKDGKLASLPTPRRSGYTFDGWYTAATGGTKVDTSRVYTANTIIYARWTAEQVTPPNGNDLVLPDGYAWMEGCNTCSGIIFKSDGTFQMLNQQDGTEAVITGSGTYTTNGNSVTLAGVTWYTGTKTYSVSGDTLKIINGDSFRKMSVTIVGTVGIYTITFNANGGTVTPTTATTIADGRLTTLPTPTRSGYTFDGWYTAATGGTKVETNKMYTANTTLYARWTAEQVTPPTGSLICADGEVWINGESIHENGSDGEVYLSNNEYWSIKANADGTGYATWKGTWSTSGNQLIITDANGTRTNTDLNTYSVAGNKVTYTFINGGGTETLTKISGIVWDKSFNVAFDVNGAGGTVSPTSKRTGADGKLETLPTPTRSGYTFTGWYDYYGRTEITTSTVFNENRIIYARWTEGSQGGYVSKGSDISKYKTIVIGTQNWMAENLDNDIEGGVCYENSADSCAKYGRLYSWAAARTACPVGWHLPSDAEWTTLVNYVGGYSTAGTKLKSSTGWYDYEGVPAGAGTDDHQFSALPGGFYSSAIGGFGGAGESGHWWSATMATAGVFIAPYSRIIQSQFEFVENYHERNYESTLSSVRCVQD